MSYINELKIAMDIVDNYNKVVLPKVMKYSAILEANGYPVYTKDDKDFNVNLLAIRKGTECTNKFDDTIVLFWKYKGLWTVKEYSCTTKPGLSYFNPKYIASLGGVACLVEGSYVYELGLHKGIYEALRQAEPVKVYRLLTPELDSYKVIETLASSINVHRANENNQSVFVNKWSAGCIAINRNYAEFIHLMKLSLAIYDKVSLRLVRV